MHRYIVYQRDRAYTSCVYSGIYWRNNLMLSTIIVGTPMWYR